MKFTQLPVWRKSYRFAQAKNAALVINSINGENNASIVWFEYMPDTRSLLCRGKASVSEQAINFGMQALVNGNLILGG